MASLHQAMRERERETLEITRQLAQSGQHLSGRAENFDLARLQNALGADTALVEYAFLDGECLAFIVTDETVAVARDLGQETELQAAIEQFHFQINTLRHGAARLRQHLPQLTARARRHLQQIGRAHV